MKTLFDLFNTFKEKNDRVAFELRSYRTFRFSYRDLHQLIGSVAEYLDAKDIGKGDRVVIWAPNGPWWVIAYFGIVLRGGVVVPVDFASGNARARWITESAGAKFAFASRYKAGVDLGVQTVMMEELESQVGAEGVRKKESSVMKHDTVPGDVAVCIYTSGTTGEPKGVPLTHANLVANVTALRKHVEVLPTDVFLSVLPLSHSFEMMAGCLVPLSVGAKIVYLKTIKPSAIFEALSTGTITVFASVPRLLLLLKGSVEQKFTHLHLQGLFKKLRRFGRRFSLSVRKKMFWFIQKKIGPHFRYFVSGGAALDIETARFWDDLGFTVLEGYGLTECSPVLTANQPGKVQLGSVGSPVPGVDIRIAQDGEIEARGANIFSGYADNPRATAEVFTADGWFKTGDVGELRGDILIIKTRKKDMIVTAAGMNVYPEDVEAVLQHVKGVKECTVIGMQKEQGESVHAVLVLEQGSRAAVVVAEANRGLDALQQITDWTLWDGELPKTTTMKVKKNEVKQRLQKMGDRGEVGDTAKEGVVKDIIGMVLKKDPRTIADVHRLVSDLKITSLDRAEILSRLEQEFRLDLPEDVVGKDTTVGELIKIVTERRRLHGSHRMRAWAFTRSVEIMRQIFQQLLITPFMHFLGRPQVHGLDHIVNLHEPFILASNHVSYFDQPMTLAVLPSRLAARIATAAREDFFFPDMDSPSGNKVMGIIGRIWKRFCFEYCTLFTGAFLLPIGRNVQESLAFMGKLVDRGCPIFIYPEGERSYDDTLLPFQPGLARMVQELRLPVVPVRIRGMEEIFPRGSARIRRGRAVVSFGAPLRFGPGVSAEEIVEKTKVSVSML